MFLSYFYSKTAWRIIPHQKEKLDYKLLFSRLYIRIGKFSLNIWPMRCFFLCLVPSLEINFRLERKKKSVIPYGIPSEDGMPRSITIYIFITTSNACHPLYRHVISRHPYIDATFGALRSTIGQLDRIILLSQSVTKKKSSRQTNIIVQWNLIGLKNMVHGLSRQVVFVDRFNYIEMYGLLPGICGLSRQVVFHSSGLSRQVSLYCPDSSHGAGWYIGNPASYKHPSHIPQRSHRHRTSTQLLCYTGKPLLKDHPIGHKNVVCQDRLSLVTGSVILTCRSFCQKCVLCQDRWSHGCGLST